MKRALIILTALILAIIAMAFSAYASAITPVDSLELEPPSDKGGSVYMMVMSAAKDGWFTDNCIELEFEKGTMFADYNHYNRYKLEGSAHVYPAIEAKVWLWDNAQNQWVLEQDYDIYHKKEATVEFQKTQTLYCVQLYYWEPMTVAKSYAKNDKYGFPDIMPDDPNEFTSAYWWDGDLPTAYVTPGDVKLYKWEDWVGWKLPNMQ